MEAFMYRFHPQWVRAKQIVRAGELGRITATNAAYFYTNKDPGNIRNIAGAGGGALLDIGCYAVSSARFLMGAEPERVLCTIVRDPAFKTDVLDTAILDYGDGRTSTFTVSTQLYPCQKVSAFGTNGSLTVELPFNMFADTPGQLTVFTSIGKRLVETEIIDQYLLEFDAFAQSIIEKTETPTPISDAVANMAVLDALFASGASGTWENVARY
jgi:predicted dehydrogenase